MKDVASGRLLPEMNFLIGSSTNEETTVGGEGEPRGRIVAREIQENLGIPGIPYQNCMSEDKSKTGESRKKETFS